MSISPTHRTAVVAMLSIGILLGSAGASSSAHAAGTTRAQALKPVMLVVDTSLSASGLSLAQALKSASTYTLLPVTAPTYLPSGVQLVSVNVQRPVYQVTRGTATLVFGVPNAGVTFSLQEGITPFVLLGNTQTQVTIKGWAGLVSDLGTSGKSHLVAVTWGIGRHTFALISNVAKSKLSTANLLKIANSVSQ